MCVCVCSVVKKETDITKFVNLKVHIETESGRIPVRRVLASCALLRRVLASCALLPGHLMSVFVVVLCLCLSLYLSLCFFVVGGFVCVCLCVHHVCVRACEHACMRACMRACICVLVCV